MNIHQAVALLGLTEAAEDIAEVVTPVGPVGFARIGATQVVTMPFDVEAPEYVDEAAFRAVVHVHDTVEQAITCQARAIEGMRAEVAAFMDYQYATDARSRGFGFA